MPAASADPSPTPLPAAPTGTDAALVVHIDHRSGSLRLSGLLDRGNAHHLHDTVSALLLSDRDRWAADVTTLTVTDHAGLKAIGAAYRRLLRADRRITFHGTSPALRQALTRLRLDHHMLDTTTPRTLTLPARPDGPPPS